MRRGLHPAGWAAWLAAVSVYALVASNPWHLIGALSVVLLVHLSAPSDPSPMGRAVRTFVLFGLALLFVRLAFVGLLPNPGRTTIAHLPRLTLPGVTLGGPLTAEVLAQATSEGLRLVVVLAAFGVFNARADLAQLLRSVPPALRELGLVVGIAAAFVPGLLGSARDVRDAQRMRGERGMRALAPSLAVPILGRTIDRAFLLAESMDARGYGAAAGHPPGPLPAAISSIAIVAGVAAWTAGWREIAGLLVAAGAGGLVVFLRTTSRASGITRLARRGPGRADLAVTVGAGLASLSAWLPEASWSAYPVLRAPPFWMPALLPLLLFAAPALVEPRRR